jgi:hypothetical protein
VVTAEFAVALPAVILVLVLARGAMGLVGEQVRLQSAVSSAARLLGRGDPGGQALVGHAVAGGTLRVERVSGLICADARAPARFAVLVPITIAARACALDDAV